MDAQRWLLLSGLFDSALDLPAAQRDAYIVEVCANDTELAGALRRMLAADADAESDSFLETPLAVPGALDVARRHRADASSTTCRDRANSDRIGCCA